MLSTTVKPKSSLAVVRPESAATSLMPKVPTRSAKPTKTSTKEERLSPRTPLCWRPNSNLSSPGLYEGPYREKRWRRAPMAVARDERGWKIIIALFLSGNKGRGFEGGVDRQLRLRRRIRSAAEASKELTGGCGFEEGVD
ncbi:hypothetical protein B296_00004202 [Ensete ventricosum]|uniref:Uncharacterized protein n=1 Tax=Ensete ventricosum TaxID=4639 RepID=A0A426XVV3_ENSVE|nr:hypothetical protein B296_00004202 [Ensete ventricosum]